MKMQPVDHRLIDSNFSCFMEKTGRGRGGGGWMQSGRSELVELLACSKRDLYDLCVENGLDPKGKKNVLLMRLLDHKAAVGAGRTGNGRGESKFGGGGEGDSVRDAGRTGARRPLLLGLGAECLDLVFKSMVREEVDDDVGPVGDWRREVIVLSKLAKVCTMFRDAARLLIDPILSRGSIRDWPEMQQMPLIQVMCARRHELSLTLVDHAELPLLLLLVLKCDVSALTSLRLNSNMGNPRLYWTRIMKGRKQEVEIRDVSVHDDRAKKTNSFFSEMASSLEVSLPSPDFFLDEYDEIGDWAAFGRYGDFPILFLTMSLSYCPALVHLETTGFRLDANFFNALPGCRHLTTLKVIDIPGGISVEPWKGHGLTTLTLSRHIFSPSSLDKLLPILQSLTSLYIDAHDTFGCANCVTLQSKSLRRFTIHRKVVYLDQHVFDFPNLRVFHHETFFQGMPFEGKGRIVSFLNSHPLLEEYGQGRPPVSDDYSDGSAQEDRVFRIPPGRPVATATLREFWEYIYFRGDAPPF
jgi:hypothetical protein